jgi:hypothetical protein
VQSTTADNLSSTFADLHALIDPIGAATSYQFQYLTQGEFEANGNSFAGEHAPTALPATPAAIGSGGATGSVAASVVQHLGGLQPATAYRFRVVAVNEVGATVGAEASFATLPPVSLGLPDNRAYELLTPLDKGTAEDLFASPNVGGDRQVFVNRDIGVPSESGDQFLLTTKVAFGPFPAAGENAYVFSRTTGGWHTTSLASPSLGVQSVRLDVFDPFDLSGVGVSDLVGSEAGPGGAHVQTLLGPPGGGPGGALYSTLHGDPPRDLVSSANETRMVGASRDLGRVFLGTSDHSLTVAAEGLDPGAPTVYESSGGGECTHLAENCPLVGVQPDGAPFACGAELGQAAAGGAGLTHNAVSADGSRVFLTAPAPQFSRTEGKGLPGCWDGKATNTPQLYLRSGGETVEVSRPEAGTEPTRRPAVYAGASDDGSRVFFLSEGELTKDDAGIHDRELYEWRSEGTAGPTGVCELPRGCLGRISAGETGKAAAAISTVPAVSGSGSAVYFTAFGSLAAGAPALPQNEQYFEPVNLYRYDTTTGATAYIATINTSDYYKRALTSTISDFSLNPIVSWYATPDGRYLLFDSINSLTGYDNTHAGSSNCNKLGFASTSFCEEVFRYDAGAPAEARLACLSCKPSGASPSDNVYFSRALTGTESPSEGAVRAISNDGAFAFFETADALVPSDVNGTLDVYEWEARGRGDCQRPGGCVRLISSGHDSQPSYFLGMSPDGSNVFFGTHSRLVSQDRDSAGDLYDARICTGADPCFQASAGETAQCEGDACHNPPPAPIDASPASLSFSGAGNLASEPPSRSAPSRTAAQVRAERLARALKACRKVRSTNRRARCERAARRSYGTSKASRASKRRRTGR